MVHPESAKLAEKVLSELGSTEYACSSLEPLAGGTVNFIFKGILRTPLPDGTQELAIKHGESYIAANPNFNLPLARCDAEEECLKALRGLSPTPGPFTVRVPKLYHYNKETNTQVLEYLADAVSLKEYALKHFQSQDASRKPLCHEIGRSLGAWLRGFHDWVTLPEQAGLHELMRSNQQMQQLKHIVNYSFLVQTVADFPSILADAKDVFEQVETMSAKELERPDLQVIHGDFWTGNTLLPDRALQNGAEVPIFIVDWESCQLGLRPLDMGQMIAELYQLVLYKGMDEGMWLIEGLTAGYGDMDDDFAFRAALHVGTHMICFGSRVPGWGSDEQVREVVRTGKELILRAWHKDRKWFEAADLACLFSRP